MEDARKRLPEAADELSLYIKYMRKIEQVMELARAAEE